jgi:3',5'-cyclic AMP phosphodiesterase CpdA
MTDRIIAIGDIHGCSKALATLLEAIQPTPQDMLVFLGDFIDRGPDSRGVLEQGDSSRWPAGHHFAEYLDFIKGCRDYFETVRPRLLRSSPAFA